MVTHRYTFVGKPYEEVMPRWGLRVATDKTLTSKLNRHRTHEGSRERIGSAQSKQGQVSKEGVGKEGEVSTDSFVRAARATGSAGEKVLVREQVQQKQTHVHIPGQRHFGRPGEAHRRPQFAF